MYGGRVRFTVPVLWSIGFMVTFVIGGMTGVLMAVPPTDFQLHNSLFLIAHFHNVIIGGVLFGAMAGYNIVIGSPRRSASGSTNAGARHRFSLTALVRQAARRRAQVLRLIATLPPGRPAP